MYSSFRNKKVVAAKRVAGDIIETRHRQELACGPAIQQLKAERKSCKDCKYYRKNPGNFGYERCTLKDTTVRYYNICAKHETKE